MILYIEKTFNVIENVKFQVRSGHSGQNLLKKNVYHLILIKNLILIFKYFYQK